MYYPSSHRKVQGLFEHINIKSLDEADKVALNSRIREILMQVYRFGFEFYKEMSDATPPSTEAALSTACRFSHPLDEACRRALREGRGMRPDGPTRVWSFS
ncbi:hypothetical protein NQ317_018194 [Molorchus minor]|uniref:Uncharacterized protein n=1 Tax=Molorchus minor TaxID=1323400 RepID=A0ABQ9JY46_9CUCU|nr:hypothetical protein NQ317_018194 [Molorchus minor]